MFSKVLEVASEFDVQDTSPELQHAFCALWNQIVLHVENHNDGSTATHILRPICDVYTALHTDTNFSPPRFYAPNDDLILLEPSPYPVCNVADHIHGTVLHDTASLHSPDAHSSSVPTPPRVDESHPTVPSLDNSHPTHQTIVESLRIPVTSPDPSAASAIRDVVTPAITVPRFTPDTSTSTPLSSTSQPAAVSLPHNPDPLTPSDPPNLPSASSDPVLDNIPPTGPPLPSHSPTTRSDLSPSFPESHRSIIVTTIPSTSPGPTSTLDLSAEDGGSRRDNDVGPPSVNRAIHANTVVTVDLLPPLSRPVTDPDAAITGRSLQAEHNGDQSPCPSHRQYDIV
ncbi:hypothetical protein EDB84DRAFT_1571299 [Lactarius hengduanensis]|nr:hypothetical protein EDB84DRAFT_1571299 [Lactarius hengduanensis]